MPELAMNHLDLLFRGCDLGGLECFQVADVAGLKVFDSRFVARVETVSHRRDLIV